MDDSEDTFRILLATDNHLGYGENDPIRENDTFVTFEEILSLANRENVDFILLGGDLFHEARPSPYCLHKCIELIRKYCLGDKPVEIEFLSDPSVNFQQNNTVNYEDPNVNISIPIFSIHGNHDDPTGVKQVSAMDLISATGLINYFGRWDRVTDVEVNPILLKKGSSRLALFGLSHIRDERLTRLFIDKKVVMKTPENANDWFNVLILHQNRANRGVKNFIAESFVPEFVDLVMWGHEHDCRIEPMQAADRPCFVTQPGSSVATSLAEGESITKKVGLLRVNGKNFRLTPIELRTVRPFVFNDMILEPPQGDDKKVTHADKAQAKIAVEIDEMIERARGLGRRRDLLPLIRLVVKFQDECQTFNAIKFGRKYRDRVANPDDIIKFSSLHKKAQRVRATLNDGEDIDEQIGRVEDLLPKYFDNTNQLKVLSISGLTESVRRFIDAKDNEAPKYIINNQEKYTLEQLNERQPDEEEIEACLEQLRGARDANEFRNILTDPNRLRTLPKDSSDVEMDESDEASTSSASLGGSNDSKKARGSARGRGTRGGRGSRAKKT